MRRIRTLLVAGLLTAGLVLPATAASAAVEACYDVDVVVNGDAVVDESDCVTA